MNMLKKISSLFERLEKAPEPLHISQGEQHIAVAALLLNLVSIDGTVREEELSCLGRLLAKTYDMETHEVDALLSAARQAEEKAVDLYRFTSLLKQNLDDRQRQEIVSMMWELVYSDGELHAFEDNALWRMAELLGISARDRMALKRAVKQKLGIEN